jgi:hypothetical protein
VGSKRPTRGVAATKEPLTSANLGVFKDNRARPIHRWYPFLEGYSSDLVTEILDSAAAETVVMDPFAGSGTTLLAASIRNLTSVFCEVNPYLAWVTKVKVNSSRLVTESDLAALERFVKVLQSSTPSAKAKAFHPLLDADMRRNFFPVGVAQRVVTAMAWIDMHLDGPSADLAKMACTTSLIASSNMVRRTDLRKRTPSDPAPVSFIDAVIDKLKMMQIDCRVMPGVLRTGTQQLATDVRTLSSGEPIVDLIVTSPPYLNGTNYCRNTKLEMLALKMLETENDLSDVRSQSITAGINNVSRRRDTPKEIPDVESIVRELDVVAYDSRIPKLVRAYFSDMETAFGRLRQATRPRGRLFLDIGDSQFAGVHVPTHDLLTSTAETQGWAFKSTRLIRSRRSYDGSQLSQVLLEFVAR